MDITWCQIGFMLSLALMTCLVGSVVNDIPRRLVQYKSKQVYFGKIWWDPEWNPRTDYGNAAQLIVFFMRRGGWSPQQEAIVEPITEEELVKVARPNMRKMRIKLMGLAQAAEATREDKLELEWFDRFYMVDGMGVEFIDPEYRGGSGNRRASVYPRFCAKAQIHNENYTPGQEETIESAVLGKIPDLDHMIPVKIPDTPSGRFCDFNGHDNTIEAEEVRLEEVNLENTEKVLGAKPYNPSEYLNIARLHVIKFKRNQTYVRLHIGVSTTEGVRLYWMVMLDEQYRDLDILAHATSQPYDPSKGAPGPDNDPLHIELNRIDYKKLQEFGLRMQEKAELEETNLRRQKLNKPKEALTPLTKGDVRRYFFATDGKPAEYKTEKVNNAKSMSQEIMTGQIKTNGDYVVKETLRAVIANTLETIPHDSEISRITNMLWDSKFPRMELEPLVLVLENIMEGGLTASQICKDYSLKSNKWALKEEVEHPTNADAASVGGTTGTDASTPTAESLQEATSESVATATEEEDDLDAEFASAPAPKGKGKGKK